ncbi:glutaminyl-peptide cyclotransferase-like isoform X2 [Haliotis rubra]|uniref:glutaminyl-peptide cyclotransferase-like isoform X1 n=1 Tax=Haliotis rubra TaxID=36100 RepID=UPI001EE58DCC|nr:glutaminyl-peptide cyclotransferase-like isoform X1 [Haliotis rubra]XP_046577556.1 glutaminyl-peptide cyclotransferase-like isoform X2 [Haliotis rubra]
MKYNDCVLWITSLLICLSIKSTHEASGTRKRRSLKWQTDSALQVLSEIFSDMKSFKEQELMPFMKVRVSGTKANKEVQQHIKNRLNPLGWTIEEDQFTDSTPQGTKEFTNIIATFNPSAAERLVLACHFDSKYYEKIEFIGATDSAVPCAILLDLAKQLSCLFHKEPAKESAKNLTVQLVFFDGEEAFKEWSATDSIYGARHLAQMWADKPDPVTPSRKYISTITDFVLLDLIEATDTRFANIVVDTSDLYTQLNKIEKSLEKKNLLRRQQQNSNGYRHQLFPSMSARNAGVQDDHVPFQAKGVSILHLISYPFPQVWHTKRDNLASLDFTLIDDFNRIFRNFVASYLQYNGLQASGCKNATDRASSEADADFQTDGEMSCESRATSGGTAAVSDRVHKLLVVLPLILWERWSHSK